MMNQIEIYKGAGEFNIVGTKDCSIFEFRNRPKIMVWEMNWNSLFNFFVGIQAKERILYLDFYFKLEAALNEGTINDDNCIELLDPLLNQFTNAKYKIEIEETRDAYHIIYPGEPTYQDKQKTKHIIWNSIWAGGNPYIYSFQNISNSERTEFYKREIYSGLKPQILIMKAEESEVEFILDGHHKLNAYNRTKINANIVRITKLNNHNISDERIMKAFNKLEKKRIDPIAHSEKVPMEADLRTKIVTHLKELRAQKKK
ncbi:hypothetical protein N9B82_02945 [Saprospiraceae bacterium]|nr:hypothetical protein [Saprospiraceae bacterium]